MSEYNESKFLVHFLRALEDVLEENMGQEGLIAISLQVAKHIREILCDEFKNASKIDIKDFGAFVENASRDISRRLGLDMEIKVQKEDGTYKVITRLSEGRNIPAVMIPLTIVAIVLEEARQRGNKKFVISDAKIAGDAFEFRLLPI